MIFLCCGSAVSVLLHATRTFGNESDSAHLERLTQNSDAVPRVAIGRKKCQEQSEGLLQLTKPTSCSEAREKIAPQAHVLRGIETLARCRAARFVTEPANKIASPTPFEVSSPDVWA